MEPFVYFVTRVCALLGEYLAYIDRNWSFDGPGFLRGFSALWNDLRWIGFSGSDGRWDVYEGVVSC